MRAVEYAHVQQSTIGTGDVCLCGSLRGVVGGAVSCTVRPGSVSGKGRQGHGQKGWERRVAEC